MIDVGGGDPPGELLARDAGHVPEAVVVAQHRGDQVQQLGRQDDPPVGAAEQVLGRLNPSSVYWPLSTTGATTGLTCSITGAT